MTVRNMWGYGAALAMLASCTFNDIDLDGRQCPCVEGWVCVPGGICLREEVDGGTDAQVDSGDAGDSGDTNPTDATVDAVVDSGALDGATIDAMTDAGPAPSLCSTTFAGRLFCDGFDVPSLFPWAIATPNLAEVAYSTDEVYRGAGSLRAEVFAGNSRNVNAGVLIPGGVSSGELHGRFYLFLPSDQPYNFVQFFNFIEEQAPFGAVDLAITDEGRLFMQVRTTGSVQDTATSAVSLPRDRWLCVQIGVVVSATAGSADVAVDGTSLVTLTDLPTLPAAGFEALAVGVNFAAPGQMPTRLFLDEVVFDQTEIPCDL